MAVDLTASNWYYVEEEASCDDTAHRKGPFTLESLIENAPSNSLVSNDDLLQTQRPWIPFMEVLESIDDGDDGEIDVNHCNNDNATNHSSNDTVNSHPNRNSNSKVTLLNNRNPHQHPASKKIHIQLDAHTNDLAQPTTTTTTTTPSSPIADHDILRLREQQQQKQEEKEKAKQAAELQQQVLRIEANDKFDEEWFVLLEAKNETLGPFSRWQVLKQVQCGELHANSVMFLNGSKEFRYLRMCGELAGVLPFIERDATIQLEEEESVVLTKHALESKLWLYKDAYQQQQGPVSLSEIFYKLADGILGRNSEIKQDKQVCWKTVEFIQKKFSKEWAAMKTKLEREATDRGSNVDEDSDIEDSDIASDIDEQETEMMQFDPSFRALIDLDKKVQIERKRNDDNDSNSNSNQNSNSNTQSDSKTNVKRSRKRKKRGHKKANTSIYVTGLPLNVSLSEVEEFFKTAGMIATDIYDNGRKRMSLYRDEQQATQLSGEAFITYHQPHSVQLALQMLDEKEIRDGYRVHVQSATAQHHRRHQQIEPRRKKRKLDPKKEATLKQLYGVDTQLGWDEDADRMVPQLQWVVLRNMFTPQQAQIQMQQGVSMEQFVRQLEDDIVSECGKIGSIDKVEIFETNPNGIVKVKFKHPQHAAQCIERMHQRYFDGNVLECFYWNGTDDYHVHETAEQQQERLKRFQQAMQNDERSTAH